MRFAGGNPLTVKQAQCVALPAQSEIGFYSRYFLVPKWGGTIIFPISDVQTLNNYLRYLFLAQQCISNVDLKHPYVHVPIYPNPQKVSGIGFAEYNNLPFGVTLSPRVFTRGT